MKNHNTIELDVRSLVANGQSPLPVILGALEKAGSDGVLRLLVPFEPTPLYAFLGAQGYSHTAQQLKDGTWEVWFQRTNSTSEDSGEQTLDLRDLDPPEPMRQAMAALPKLGRHETLTILTRFRPVHLIDQLPSRGYESDSDEIGPEEWETRIWRKLSDPTD